MPALIPPVLSVDQDDHDKGCQRVITLPQRTGVCWFTAIMMAFFYSDGMKTLLIDRMSKWRVHGDGTLAKRKRKLYSIFKELLISKQTYTVKKEDYKVFKLMSPERVLRLLHLSDRAAFNFDPRVDEGYWPENYIGPLFWFMHIGFVIVYKSSDLNDKNLYMDLERRYVPDTSREVDVIILINNVKPSKLAHLAPTPYTVLSYSNSNMITLSFQGLSYHLDSNIITNFNACGRAHAIAGITCHGKRFVYNGWMRNTIDPAMLAAGIQISKTDHFPCELMPYDWDSLDSGDFCLNPQTCKLDPLDHQSFASFCFNFQKGPRVQLFVRNPHDVPRGSIIHSFVQSAEQSVASDDDPGFVPTQRLLNDQQLQCIRQVSNWTQLKPVYKFESKDFDPAEFTNAITINSPKLLTLLRRIRKLDLEDLQAHQKLYKHFIFSDLKHGYGAKIVTSALLAKGYTMAFTPDHKLKSAKQLASTRGTNIALLCSTELYGKPLSVKFKKEVLAMFNDRPGNVHGNQIRFIVMDSGFKEGIDLFDIKYVHLFEPQTSAADTQQVIGRGTRTCGQKGLVFHPTRGWPLHVSIYDVGLPDDLKELDFMADTLFEFYMDNMGLDMRRLRLAEELERMAASEAVDCDLTQAVHAFRLDAQTGGRQAIWSGECASLGPCKKRTTTNFPVSTPLLLAAWLALPDINQQWIPVLEQRQKQITPREIICNMVKHDEQLCKLLKKEALVDEAAFLAKHERIIRQNLDLLSASGWLSAYYVRSVKALFPAPASSSKKKIKKKSKTPSPRPPTPKPSPPPGLPRSRRHHLYLHNHNHNQGQIQILDSNGCVRASGGIFRIMLGLPCAWSMDVRTRLKIRRLKMSLMSVLPKNRYPLRRRNPS